MSVGPNVGRKTGWVENAKPYFAIDGYLWRTFLRESPQQSKITVEMDSRRNEMPINWFLEAYKVSDSLGSSMA